MQVSADKIYSIFSKQKMSFIVIQFLSGMIALGFWIWDVTNLAKTYTIGRINFNLYPWTFYYFHPIDSNLLNYVFLCVIFSFVAVIFYLLLHKKNLDILHNRLEILSPLLIAFCSITSMLLLVIFVSINSIVWRSIIFLFMISLVFSQFIFAFNQRLAYKKKSTKRTYLIFSLVLFAVLILEPLKTIFQPVYLLNDYPSIYSKTLIKGSCRDNGEFLKRLDNTDIDMVKAFLAIFNEIDVALRIAKNTPKISKEGFLNQIDEGESQLFQKFNHKNLEPGQEFLNLLINDPLSAEKWNLRFQTLLGTNALINDPLSAEEWNSRLYPPLSTNDFIKKIKTVDMEALKQFYLTNYFEYWLQNMGRGQIHHIGHFLNPINEYELGKSTNNIFIQYGVGTTLLTKWIMDIFGGISIHNFYKTYIFYILYYLTFLFMTFALFKDRLYACASFSIMPCCFFSLGFVAYILAPGFIPTVHILDAITFLVLMLFLQSNQWRYFGILALLIFFSIIINRQFGMILSISVFLSLLLYMFENHWNKYRFLWSFALCAIFFLAVASYKLSCIGALDKIFQYFWLGWLSWPVSKNKIACTIIYLIISYFFIVLLRNHRFYLKYLYAAIFLYAQGLLIYYYWSGVRNHIPTVFPFIWLQSILMLYIIEKYMWQDKLLIKNIARFSVKFALVLSIIFFFFSFAHYYSEKSLFKANFENHKLYTWEFDRAHVFSTINPELIKESVNLIETYNGPNDPSIYILSKYDGLIPFLAKKYSAMLFFELTSFIFSEKESSIAVNKINFAKPEYIFVDSNISEASYDPWMKVYRSDFTDRERASRLNRYAVLKNIFMAIKGDYVMVEEGSLLSVYKRKKV